VRSSSVRSVTLWFYSVNHKDLVIKHFINHSIQRGARKRIPSSPCWLYPAGPSTQQDGSSSPRSTAPAAWQKYPQAACDCMTAGFSISPIAIQSWHDPWPSLPAAFWMERSPYSLRQCTGNAGSKMGRAPTGGAGLCPGGH